MTNYKQATGKFKIGDKVKVKTLSGIMSSCTHFKNGAHHFGCVRFAPGMEEYCDKEYEVKECFHHAQLAEYGFNPYCYRLKLETGCYTFVENWLLESNILNNEDFEL